MKTIKTLSMVSLLTCAIAVPEAMADSWNVSLWGKRRAFTEHVEKLAELVKERSNGEFTLKISYGGLSKNRENLDGISFGAFEMAQFCSFYHKGKNPTITVNELPFSQDVSLSRIADIYSRVYQHPIVVKDLARWNATLLMPTPLPQYNMIAKGEPLKKLSEFSGMRVRGPGGITGVLDMLGATKTSVPFGEVRQSMDSGVIDAATFAPHAHLATKTVNIGKWATENLNLGSADCPVVVNTEALEMLKPEHRTILMDAVPDALKHYVDYYEGVTVKQYQQALKDHNVTMVRFTPKQTEELNRLAASVREEWIANYQRKFDSQALFTFTENLFLEKQ